MPLASLTSTFSPPFDSAPLPLPGPHSRSASKLWSALNLSLLRARTRYFPAAMDVPLGNVYVTPVIVQPDISTAD